MTLHSSPSIDAIDLWRQRAATGHTAFKEYWIGEALATAGLAAFFFALAIAVLAGAQHYGFLDTEAMFGLSGQAVMAAEGRMTAMDAVAAFPPLPLLVTLPFAYATPGGAQPAVLASAFIAALFATVLFQNFRYRGYSQPMALVVVLLLTANPLALQALVSGPGAILMLFILFVLANSMFELASKGKVSDIVLAGIALIMLACTHASGLALALAALPGLTLVVPQSIFTRMPRSPFLLPLFPLCFALAAFLLARGEVLTLPASGTGAGSTALRAALAIVVSAPLTAAFSIWMHRRKNMGFAALAVISLVVGAAVLQPVLGSPGIGTIALAGSLAVAAACALHAPNSRLHQLYICVLLAAGVPGGGLVVAANAAAKLSPATVVAAGESRAALVQIRDILLRRDGVLIDTASHPALVAARGTTRGLVTPGQPEFEAQLRSRRLASEFVVVTQADTTGAPDRIAAAYPDLYKRGAAGYQLVYDRAGWRVYARPGEGPGLATHWR